MITAAVFIAGIVVGRNYVAVLAYIVASYKKYVAKA